MTAITWEIPTRREWPGEGGEEAHQLNNRGLIPLAYPACGSENSPSLCASLLVHAED
jgi:hypothetical protein